MVSLYELDALQEAARRLGVPDPALRRFRIGLLKHGLPLAECLLAVPEEVRAPFAAAIADGGLAVVERRDSAVDGATKLVLQAPDGARVEAVLLRIGSGRTSLCLSCQAGCAAGCAFCATGHLGLRRNLTVAEILDQVVQARRLLRAEGRVLRNVVFMGMGEPFHNEREVCRALEVLRDPRGCHVADRHLLVSTVGVPAAIARFAERFPGVRLAVSLHSARQEVRARIMPAARRCALPRLREALAPLAPRGTLMIEYLLLRGVNDGPEDRAALAEFLRAVPAHLNLITFNPWPGAPFEPVARAEREAFADALRREGVTVTLRYSLGADIGAACGQLAAEGVT